MATVGAAGGSSHVSREARRRRIVDRGADRLALITGRIQALPPATCPPGQSPADIAQRENVASNSPLPNLELDETPVQRQIFDETIEPLLDNTNKGETISSRPVAPLSVEEEQQSQISSTATHNPVQVHRTERSFRKSFTMGQISSAITASENIRMFCSVAAAILVILSYIESPVLGCRIIKSVVIFKPVYLLLLTNISIVVGQLIMGAKGAELRMGQTSSGPKFGGNGLVDQLGQALESGLLLQKIFGALFIDFGIYAVMLVCGLSLVRKIGW